MKKISMTFAAVALAGSLAAQDSGFSAGLDLALPLGDFGDAFSLGVGPVVGYDSQAGDQGLLGVTLGYSFLSGKEEGYTSGKMLLITGHYKYFFSDVREGAYVAPMIGWGMIGYHIEYEVPGVVSYSGDESAGGMSFGVGAGYFVTENIDIGLRWQAIRATADGDATASSGEASVTNSFIGLSAMYNF